MKKILKFFKFLKGQTDRDMVNVSQFSPRVTRSKSKKLQNQKSSDAESPKQKRGSKIKNEGKKIKETGEVNSVRGVRGSVGSLSLLQTPKACESLLQEEKLPPKEDLRSSSNIVKNQSFIGTISADTPQRTERLQMQIENIAQCRLRVLGKGSFGTIIQATYKGELVAAKVVPANKSNSLRNELNNFLLSHPNIVKTLRVISNEENNSCGLVIMEMCSSCTMEHLIEEESYDLNEKSVVSFMSDIAQALDYCHSQLVLHLDVKPQNMLVNVANQVCKLCDFGSSCLLREDVSEDYRNMHNIEVYNSPELLTGSLPTEKSDVYSFGITLWELVHRQKPFAVDNKTDLQSTINKIVKQKKRPQEKIKKCRTFDKLYTSCWDHEPEKRPTMKEVIQYLKNI